jgi:hypothetical protein
MIYLCVCCCNAGCTKEIVILCGRQSEFALNQEVAPSARDLGAAFACEHCEFVNAQLLQLGALYRHI